MQATTGDRVSLESKKVGQPRRCGVVVNVSEGLSGARYQIRWDDGHESFITPGAGVLIVEGRDGNAKAKKTKKSAGQATKSKRR